MRTLDTMKLAIMMETSMWSSWLIRFIPLNSLSMKVIGGGLHGDIVDVNVLDDMEVALAGQARLSFVGESANNGNDHPFFLLGGFLFLWRLLIASWLIVSLSSSIFCFVSSVHIGTPMLLLLVSSRSCSYLLVVRLLDELV